MIMNNVSQITTSFQNIQDQKLLTLHWCLFSEWGREQATFYFNHKGGQHSHHVLPLTNHFLITWHIWPEIIEAPVMLTFKRQWWCYCFHFCPSRRPMISSCLIATESFIHYIPYQTKNCWRSMAADFAMGVSAILNHFISHNMSLIVFWQPCNHLHVLSPLWYNCSLIIHIRKFPNMYCKVSANCW